jgi:hypothetical protein
MKLSKRVPAHTKTVKAEWCKKDFMLMSQRFRDIRARSKRPLDACHWCKHKFADGEMMALACFRKIGNRTLCQKCAGDLIASDAEGGAA